VHVGDAASRDKILLVVNFEVGTLEVPAAVGHITLYLFEQPASRMGFGLGSIKQQRYQ
jgi:hypothetical protein